MMRRYWMMLALLGAVTVQAATKQTLKPGQPAPDFAAASTAGGTAKLADYKGKWLALCFFSKSFTDQCTTEMGSLRDAAKDLADLNVVVLAVSRDPTDLQAKFKADNKLPFDLLYDAERKVAKDYEVLGFGGLYQRRTIVVDPDGKLAHIFYAVSPKHHGEELADQVRKLQQKASK